MPLVTVDSFSPSDPEAIPRMLARAQEAGARALNCPPSNVWMLFRPIAPGHYLQESSVASPLVLIRALEGRSPAARTAFVEAIVEEVARGLVVSPASVWAHYQEMRAQDVWFEASWSRGVTR